MNGSLTWIIITVPRAFAEGRVAAVHESGNGPSRHFACAQQSGRFWREADIDWQAKPAGTPSSSMAALAAPPLAPPVAPCGRLPPDPWRGKSAIGSARALPCAAALAACAGPVLLRTIQAYLGRRNIQHTVRYTELAPDRFKDFWRS